VASNARKRPTVLAQWSRAPVPADLNAPNSPRRERLVNAVVEAMQRPLPARAVRRPAYSLLAAAAAVAALFLLVLGTVMGRTGSGSVVERLSPAHGTSSLATSAGELTGIHLSSGVTITASPDARATLTDPGDPAKPPEEVVLDMGLVQVEVPKLPAGRTFSVRTPDTVVSVHGTAFSVEVTKSALSAGTLTRVRVTHGIVGVLHGGNEALLYAGADWTSSAEAPSPGSVPTAPSRSKHPEDRAPAGGSHVVKAENQAAEPAPRSDTELATQNRLFAEAMDAREHDPARAARLLEDFIRRYPASPLTQDAYVERFRTLAQQGDRAAASRAARAYLTLYRGGFARDEARALAFDPDP
jgi:hypothetical protein